MHPILFSNLTRTRNIRWVEYVLWMLLLLAGTRANAATYYWVGGSGNWSELHHWAATSGGAGSAFNQPPSIGDNVVFNRYSFNGTKQSVTCNTVSSCANLDFSDATYTYKSTNAPTFSLSSNLSISGYVKMPSDLKFTNNGSIILDGAGTKTVCIPMTVAGSGSIQAHHLSGSWTLVSNLNFVTGRVLLNKGELNTNGKTLTIQQFSSSSSDARTLTLGSSKIQLRPVALTASNSSVVASWDISNSNAMTLNAGTSEIQFYATTNNITSIFRGGGLAYNLISVHMANSAPTSTSTKNNVTFEDDNSIKRITFTKGTALFNGSNTISEVFSLKNGHRYRFKYGTTQTFNGTASFTSSATQSSPIYIQSTSNGNYATFSKPAGIVCTDHVYINHIKAIGGASWNSASTNFNQSPAFISGWNFGGSSAQINATIQGGIKCKGEAFNLKLTFSGTTFPVTCVLQDMWTQQYDTIENITNSIYYHSVNPSFSTSYKVVEISSSGCYNATATLTGVQALVEVPLYGRLATWLGLRSSDWYDCNNWDNNAVPEDTVDVVIVPNQMMTQPVIASGSATTQQIEIAYDADLTLFGSNTSLNVFGDFINHGTFNPNDAQISFIGNNVAAISGGDYQTLVINNTTPDGIALQDSVAVSGTLTLNNGIVNTNGNLINITNSSPSALTNFGADNYVNGVLQRSISDTSTYSFPVGDDVIYALVDIKPRGSTGGVTSLKVQFINKPGTDDGLDLNLNGVAINSVHPAGIWLIEPDQQPLFGDGLSGDYELTFHLDGFPNLADYNFYVLTRHDTSSLAKDWTVASEVSGNQIVDGKLVVSGITHFSQWGIGQGGGNPLPVKMTEFKAAPVDNKYIQLKWTTETEVNNSGFLVERSIDGEEYSNIGFVPGNGNSTELHSYTFNDKNVESRKRYYYRLKQIDNDGTSEYSKVVSAQLGGDKQQRIGEFIPNPTSNIANVDIYSAIDQKVTFEFKNTLGQLVKKGDVTLRRGNGTYRLDVSDLSSGNYLVVINTAEQIYTKKLVVRN